MLSAFQSRVIFPTHLVGQAGPLPAGSEKLVIDTPDKETLQGHYIPPRDSTGQADSLVIGFGGNAWNGADVAAYLRQLYPDRHVVAFHYRGYRPSTGTPSAKALLADVTLVYDTAVDRAKPSKVMAVGFSIGSGVAAHLARSRQLDGLILVTPFDSLRSVAQSLYPWLPVGPLFEHEMDTAEALRSADVPVAIIAAGQDEVILAERTGALRTQIRELSYDRTIQGAGHNDLYVRDDFKTAMLEAMESLGPD